MPVNVNVGGQHGSDGKVKVCTYLALDGEADYMLRCGGLNCGPTTDKLADLDETNFKLST